MAAVSFPAVRPVTHSDCLVAFSSRGVWCLPASSSQLGPAELYLVGAAAAANSTCRCQAAAAAARAMKSGFHSVELNKTVWEVPER